MQDQSVEEGSDQLQSPASLILDIFTHSIPPCHVPKEKEKLLCSASSVPSTA